MAEIPEDHLLPRVAGEGHPMLPGDEQTSPPTIGEDHMLPQQAGQAHAMLGGAGGADAPVGDLAMRMLYDEQTRLRAELDELRKKDEEKQKKGGDKEEGDNKEGGDNKDDKGDDDKGEKTKPPLKERAVKAEKKAEGWVHEHPIATASIVLGLVALVIAAILIIHYLDSYVTTDDAFVDGHTDPISFRVSGIVKAVYVENTYFVKKGQLLVELDARDNQVARQQASANYAQAKAATRAQVPNVTIVATDQVTRIKTEDYDVVGARANVAASEERYRAAVADLHQAEAQEGNAVREEERYRLLVVKEEVTREQYDQRATQARVQAAVVTSRRESAAAANRAVTQAESQLEQAKAQAEQARQDTPRQVQMQREMLAQRQAAELGAKAQADQAELNFEYTRIFAPEDGIIGDKQVQVATQVAPGQELFALTQTNEIWVTANFKETDIRRMRAGQSVTVYVDALKQKFEGWIEALPGGTGAIYSLLPPENATGNYVKVVQRLPVRIRLHTGQDGEQRLTPGMSVEPKVWLR